MSKNILIKNNIKKKFYNNNLYLKDKKKINKIIKTIYNSFDTNKDTFHILSKKFELNINKIKLKRFDKYKTVVLIGMGGSILGAQAIYSFYKKKINKKFIFLNNLDQSKIEEVKKNINYKECLFIIISKSGNTLETLINVSLFKDKINNKNTIIITEKKESLLCNFAIDKNILQINHKNYIGGRYSVLSEVGMIPAHFMGLKSNLFRKNLASFFLLKKNSLLIDSAAKLKQIYNSKKINTIIFLSYAPELNDFLYWCQQLLAESLGKKGKGILPIVSQAPKDHHSLLQLYLDGPKDKLFYIFSLKSNKNMYVNKNVFGDAFKFAENQKLSKVIEEQKNALTKSLRNKNIPYRDFKVNKIEEETFGELFSYFISETALVGNLIGVDPFNQPAVEEVKNLAKHYLS